MIRSWYRQRPASSGDNTYALRPTHRCPPAAASSTEGAPRDMTPRIRAYSADDRAQFTSLLAIAFRSGQPYDADVPFPGEDASAFVAEQDGKLAGGFRIRHMTVTCREALLRCGGISSVAVAPEYRQRGVGSAMMTWALAHMRASGWQVTALHAFRES